MQSVRTTSTHHASRTSRWIMNTTSCCAHAVRTHVRSAHKQTALTMKLCIAKCRLELALGNFSAEISNGSLLVSGCFKSTLVIVIHSYTFSHYSEKINMISVETKEYKLSHVSVVAITAKIWIVLQWSFLNGEAIQVPQNRKLFQFDTYMLFTTSTINRIMDKINAFLRNDMKACKS